MAESIKIQSKYEKLQAHFIAFLESGQEELTTNGATEKFQNLKFNGSLLIITSSLNQNRMKFSLLSFHGDCPTRIDTLRAMW